MCDHDHIVIKKEESTHRLATLIWFSLLWNILLPILLIFITMCEKMRRRYDYLFIYLFAPTPSTVYFQPLSPEVLHKVPADRGDFLKIGKNLTK